jgi:hypothetical protein
VVLDIIKERSHEDKATLLKMRKAASQVMKDSAKARKKYKSYMEEQKSRLFKLIEPVDRRKLKRFAQN